MKAYFYSPLKALCYKNNSYLFSFSQNVKTCAIDKNDLLTFILPNDYLTSFVPVSHLDFSQNVKIIDLYDDFLFYLEPIKKRNEPFKTLFTSSFVASGIEHNLTIVSNGGTKILIDGFNSFCEIEVPITPKSFLVEKREDYFFVILKDKLISLSVFSCHPLKCVFSSCCKNYSIDDDSFTVDKFSRGVCDYVSRAVYSFKQGIEKRANYLIKRNEPKNIQSKLLKTQAFLEEVMFGGNYQNYLVESLRNNLDLVKTFFGEFDTIIPPCNEKFPNVFSLIYKTKAKYFSCAFENDKICDFSLEDNFSTLKNS